MLNDGNKHSSFASVVDSSSMAAIALFFFCRGIFSHVVAQPTNWRQLSKMFLFVLTGL